MLTHTYIIDLNLQEINFYTEEAIIFYQQKPETFKVLGFFIHSNFPCEAALNQITNFLCGYK
ncbi:MAG: hypothetical protein ACI9JT_001841 [Polaribacter sp.]|jgi:hypothetical protein